MKTAVKTVKHRFSPEKWMSRFTPLLMMKTFFAKRSQMKKQQAAGWQAVVKTFDWEIQQNEAK